MSVTLDPSVPANARSRSVLLLSVFDFFMPFFFVSVADVLFHLEFSLTRHLPVRGLDLAEQVYQKTLASEWTGVNAQRVPARMHRNGNCIISMNNGVYKCFVNCYRGIFRFI